MEGLGELEKHITKGMIPVNGITLNETMIHIELSNMLGAEAITLAEYYLNK
jgi:hypothetical protein